MGAMPQVTINERPILFSGPMVKAILEGRKTQTRRPIKPQPIGTFKYLGMPLLEDCIGPLGAMFITPKEQWLSPTKPYHRHYPCPYGEVGDRLWVRETFTIETNFNLDTCDPPFNDGRPVKWTESEEWGKFWDQPHYRATDPTPQLVHEDCPRCDENGYCSMWKPSIHMPRWASRITLENISVRVERIRDIQFVDCRKEGYDSTPEGYAKFAVSWNEIYPGSWDRNDWVWVVEFKRV